MNEYDSSRMLDLLFRHYGTKKTDLVETADLLILNTCSIREKAQEKVFSDLGRWRILKERRPEIMIAVAGCVASQEGENILQRAPFVDVIFGPQTIHKLPELLDQAMLKHKPQVNLNWDPVAKFDNLPEPKVDGPCAYLSIMEGCNKYCSFCIVPYTRGHEISRRFNDVIIEASQLAEQGVKEITLLGQNVNAYRSTNANGEAVDLAILLQYIAEIPGIQRLRFTTSHPKEFKHNLIEAYQYIPKLANHLHLPIQSGSDVILNKMKRGYTTLEYLEKIKQLRQIRPGISISSDFIIGFPGETEKDFNATVDIIDKVGFDNSFSFIYSKRPGTPAANYPDNVPLEIKKQRLKIVQDKILASASLTSQTMVNTTQSVIVANVSNKDPNLLCGRTENNRLVIFPGPANLVGEMANIKITESLINTLKGNIVESIATSKQHTEAQFVL